MIPLTVPALGHEEIAASERVLRSGMLVQGREVLAFEAALCASTQRKHAVAVGSGTAALELALRALGIGPGDQVLCPALTWPSPAHAVLSLGAEVVLCDVDPDEWNSAASHFVAARSERTRAAIVIDQFGNPARYREIAAALPGLPLIVDAACSLGAVDEGAPCGSRGLIACTSFHPRKVLTTGEGGACFTDDEGLADALRALRNHGQRAPGTFVCAAGNQRMTELAAAIGVEQVRKLPLLVSARRRLAARVRAAFPGAAFQAAAPDRSPNQQTLGLLVGAPGAGSATRERVMAALRERGVQSGPLSYALQTLPQFAAAARQAEEQGRSLAQARDVAERGLALPLFPGMSDEQVRTIIDQLGEALNA